MVLLICMLWIFLLICYTSHTHTTLKIKRVFSPSLIAAASYWYQGTDGVYLVVGEGEGHERNTGLWPQKSCTHNPFRIFLTFIHELLTILSSKSVYPNNLCGCGRWRKRHPLNAAVCSPSAQARVQCLGLKESEMERKGGRGRLCQQQWNRWEWI